jgi:hypothetical protein
VSICERLPVLEPPEDMPGSAWLGWYYSPDDRSCFNRFVVPHKNDIRSDAIVVLHEEYARTTTKRSVRSSRLGKKLSLFACGSELE